MLRRFGATVALWAVFLTPICSLWCACTCAEDEDSGMAAMGTMAALAADGQPAITTHDDCAADLSNAAIRAVVRDRVTHTVSWIVSPAAEPMRALFAGAGAGCAFWLMASRGGPPGLRSASVLRI